MTKALALSMALAMSAAMLAGCGGSASDSTSASSAASSADSAASGTPTVSLQPAKACLPIVTGYNFFPALVITVLSFFWNLTFFNPVQS